MRAHIRATAASLARFAGLGGISFATNVGLTAFLHELVHLPEEVAFAISLVTVFTMNFLACRYVVFSGRAGDPKRQLVLYALSSLGFRLGEYLAFLALHTWLGTPYLLAIFVVLGVSFVIKFLYYRFVVFEPDARSEILDSLR
jgi:putative flippase GtrA